MEAGLLLGLILVALTVGRWLEIRQERRRMEERRLAVIKRLAPMRLPQQSARSSRSIGSRESKPFSETVARYSNTQDFSS